MTTYNYIELTNSNSSYSRRFKATQYAPVLERTDDIQRTLSGKADKVSGAVIALHQYILRVTAEVADSQYGTYSDLKYFFLLNTPLGSPSDVITLTDHYGVQHSCYFAGTLSPENVTTVLEGPNAIFFCKIQLMEIDAVPEDDTPSG
jgi:hypothetical protein